MSDSIFFRALAVLETLCLGSLILVPLYRASSHFWLFVSVLLIGIGISLGYVRLQAKWTFAWLSRPGVIRGLFHLVCATPLLIFVLAIGVDAIFRNEQPCKDAVRMAEASDSVRKEIGEPMRIGWPIQGSSRLSGESGNATLLIPVSGVHGRATIRVVAKKAGGAWAITELTLTPLNGTGPQSLAVPITN